MLEETIKEMVKVAVLEALSEFEFTRTTVHNDEVMTTKQLAEYLQCSIPWLTKNITKLNIPHRCMGKVYRFKKDEIDNWLANREQSKSNKIYRNSVISKNTEMKIV